ncbi:MAG: M48 family metallopeptidase [Defluviitaleaceae bacterium]|nr:M48 family metallopeptidase [Defluviitaleaceae bacterium]MCL2238384.1 M48 family metallopeptidase [Defluviitaleaceae bacterium]
MYYTLTRSRRKTAAIYVRNGKVEVRAPLRMPKREIDRFVLEKEQWILKSLEKQQTQAAQKESFVIDYGSSILFRGKPYPITQRNGKHAGFDDSVFYMPTGLTPQQIKTAYIQLYKILAKSHITQRVDFFASQMGVTPAAVKINSAMKRWGSCSSLQRLNFSWRLIMADDAIIDYVVVHELAHIKEMNHSARFWTVVERVLPDFRERKLALTELQSRLSGEDWG